ncbi:TfoX/Sxy family protein [Streptomyces sp. ISL-86]|uniref:TfoX/Sxy family protein n=1 Tax=Streptomyces sp. ISL-86 TaxID=2819187 RepID=UPI001BEBBA87|nr:TfoX/Sxy family protein [Streptomyces sp. ISL-86]MBT2458480.1 TfoX/Sxy family protein [Streptomyces sp. ISL-86]
MAYDEGLAERIRARLRADPAVTEKRMFGGLAFLHAGNMAVGVIGDELMVRVGPDATDATDAALAGPGRGPSTSPAARCAGGWWSPPPPCPRTRTLPTGSARDTPSRPGLPRK